MASSTGITRTFLRLTQTTQPPYSEQSVYPTPKKTSNRKLTCPMLHCNFFCYLEREYSTHIEICHFCENCTAYCSSLTRHCCPRPNQRGGHVNLARIDQSVFKELQRSHQGVMVWYQYLPDQIYQDVESLFTEVHEPLRKLLHQSLQVHNSIVVRFRLPMVLENEEYEKVYVSYFMSEFSDLFSSDGIEDCIFRAASQIINRLNTFNEYGSRWRLREVESVEVQIASLKLFTQVKIRGYLPLPFPCKKGFINIRNKNSKCFQYCIVASKYWFSVKKTHRSHKAVTSPKNYENHMSEFDFSCISDRGVNIYQDLAKFEEMNKIGVTVFSHRDNEIVMIRKSEVENAPRVNLFLIHRKNTYKPSRREQDESGEDCHFVLITDLNKFLCLGRSHRTFFCSNCYRRFSSAIKLNKHTITNHPSIQNEDIEFPNPNYSLKFTNFSSTLPMPYILFWDFETFSKDPQPERSEKHKSQTDILKEFSPASFSIVAVHNVGNESKIVDVIYYDGEDVVRTFFERIFALAKKLISKIRHTNNFVQLTPQERQQHFEATSCFLCGREFNDQKKSRKNLHHDHTSGKYIGAACTSCNLNIKYKFEVPAICHNFSRFDLHLLMTAISDQIIPTRNISIVARSSEEFIAVKITTEEEKYKLPPLLTDYDSMQEPKPFHATHSSLYPTSWKPSNVTIQFLDSYKFLNSSLSELFAVLRKDNRYRFSLIEQCFPHLFSSHEPTVENVNLLLQKMSFPYQALKGSHVLQSGYPIPDRNSFTEDLDETPISDQHYERVQEIINHFQIPDFREFTRIYCILDSLMLAEIWSNFRRTAINSYSVDPTYFITLASFSWNCFLKYTRVELDYLQDLRMVNLLEDGIRGGPCYAAERILTANNPRLRNFDKSKEISWVLYVDFNSLYGECMTMPLPHSKFRHVPIQELKTIDWKNIDTENCDTGYILRVSLGYPESLHDHTSDLPLAPIARKVAIEELSPNTREQISKHRSDIKGFLGDKRLLLTCEPKEFYPIHFRLLKYYLKMGLTLDAIHEGIAFHEEPYIQSYVKFNLEKRKQATTAFEKSFYKAAVNIIYGRSLINVRDFIEVELCTSRVQAERLIALPRFKDFKYITPHLSAVILKPKKLLFNKPIYAGFTILEYAKLIYYNGYYQQIKNIFGDRVKLGYLDTDSAIVHIRDPQNTFYKDLLDHKHLFDFSKLPTDDPIFREFPQIPDLRSFNANKSGIWKIETLNSAEVISIKAKNYSILYADDTEESKNKGIPARVAQRHLRHAVYKQVLQNDQTKRVNIKQIRSYNHQLCIVSVEKLALHSIDIKRVYPWADNCSSSLPFGHYLLKELLK